MDRLRGRKDFLALVRGIRLNPLRDGLVATMDELDRCPRSGHAVLVGKRSFDSQEVEEVLSRRAPR